MSFIQVYKKAFLGANAKMDFFEKMDSILSIHEAT